MADELISIKEHFEMGIEKGNWLEICEAYKKLFGEDIYPPENNTSDLLDQLKSLLQPAQSAKQVSPVAKKKLKNPKKSKANIVIADNDDDDKLIQEIDERQFTRVTGPVNEHRPKPIFPCENIYSEEEAEATQQFARKDKQYRPEYAPKMKKCDKCNKSFDFNKAYPLGITGSFRSQGDAEKPAVLCQKCQNK